MSSITFVFDEAYEGYLIRSVFTKKGIFKFPHEFKPDTPIQVNPDTHAAIIDDALVQLTKLDYVLMC